MTKKELFNIMNGNSINVKDIVGTQETIIYIGVTKNENDTPVAHFITSDHKHIASIARAVVRGAKMIKTMEVSENNPVDVLFKTESYDDGEYLTFEII